MTDHLMDRHPVSRLSAKVHCYFHASVKDNCLSYGLDQMHQSNHRQEALLNKMSPAMETTEAKRPASNYMDEKVQKGTPPKKSKLELRPSCAPLKVRKEKLGDRISTLQQMVAPFGKVPHVNRTDYQLIDISEDGFVSLLTETGGTKDDLKLPTDDTLLSQIKDGFGEGKDLVVTVMSAMGEEQICALKDIGPK